MAPKTNKSPKKVTKKVRKVMSIADKLKILDLIEGGEIIAVIARWFDVYESTIRTIRANKEQIRRTSATLGHHAKFVKTVRSNLLEKTEEMTLIWIQDLFHKKIPISVASIRAKAAEFHDYLNQKYHKNEVFNASRGWFDNFKSRYSLHSLKFTDFNELFDML